MFCTIFSFYYNLTNNADRINFWIFVALVVTAIIFVIQGIYLRRSVVDASKKEVRELRAYLHANVSVQSVEGLNRLVRENPQVGKIEKAINTSFGLEPNTVTPNPPTDLVYTITFQNSGKTPARKVFVWKPDIKIIEYDPKNLIKFDKTFRSERLKRDRMIPQLSIGSGATHEKTIRFITPISEDEIGWLIIGTFSIYIFGVVDYEDVFGNPRVTEFVFSHTILRDGSYTFDRGVEKGQGNNET